MSDRLEQILKVTCVCLAVLLAVQLANLLRGSETIADLRVPEVHLAKPAKEAKPENLPGKPPPGMPPGMPMMPGGMPGRPTGPGGGGPALEPGLQARMDVILTGELFGAIPKPPPMALQGIVGRHAILRAPNGQTGLIAVGEELGGVKLLQIGTNRVLIEHEGNEKELTLFSGYGSESLLKQTKETTK